MDSEISGKGESSSQESVQKLKNDFLCFIVYGFYDNIIVVKQAMAALKFMGGNRA